MPPSAKLRDNQDMDGRDLFREQLRTVVGPALRKEGFAGSGSNWRKRNSHGDWACVNVQKSAYGTANDVSAYVNLSINPLPIHLFDRRQRVGPLNMKPSTAMGDALWFGRLDPPGRSGSWIFGDGAVGTAMIQEMVGTLREVGLPTLESLLDRATLFDLLADDASEQIKGGHLMTWSRPAMRALLLSDEGASPELEELLERLEAEALLPQHEDFSDEQNESFSRRRREVVVWIRERISRD